MPNILASLISKLSHKKHIKSTKPDELLILPKMHAVH